MDTKYMQYDALRYFLENNKINHDVSKTGRQQAASDFGRYINKLPIAVIYPNSTEQVIAIVNYSNINNIPIVVRGCAHTTGGQTLARAGFIIKMERMPEQCEIDKNTMTLTVSSGSQWKQVMMSCLINEVTPKTYSDWLELTTGGTTSTGGVGQCSFRNGMQIDNVLEIMVVTATGELMVCSREQHNHLFLSILGGLGFFGIIIQIKVQLEPAPTKVRVYKAIFNQPETCIATINRLIDNPVVQGIQLNAEKNDRNVLKNRANLSEISIGLEKFLTETGDTLYILEATSYLFDKTETDKLVAKDFAIKEYCLNSYETTFEQHVNRVPPLLKSNLEEKKPIHHHGCVFIPGDKIANYLNDCIMLDEHFPTMGSGTTLIIPIKSKIASETFMSLPDNNIYYFVGFLRRHNPSENSLEQLANVNEKVYQRALNDGGQFYLCGSGVALDDEQFWRRFIGKHYQRTVDLANAYGAIGILAEKLIKG